jgi:biopolymer transport protein ExbD
MQFTVRKRRQPPMIIIVSLIDVLLVVLIFLMVTTTFKQQPSVRLALPKANQPKSGATENSWVVTIPKEGPIYLRNDPVTVEALQAKLLDAIQANPQATVAIRADTDAAFGQVLKVVQAANAAHIPVSGAFVKAAQ